MGCATGGQFNKLLQEQFTSVAIVLGSKNNSYNCKSYPEDHDSIPFHISMYDKGEISPINAKLLHKHNR